ncbi:MAG: ABC transporter permease [Gemmatimonadetes bacterium]|nr:ABC transporter permease [Gemmatimonadota bacterium]
MNGRKLAGSMIPVIPPAILIVTLTLIETVTRMEILPSLFFPPPSAIVSTLYDMTTEGELLDHLSATVLRLLTGFLLGGIPGMILGMMMGWSTAIRRILDPFVAALHPVPKISSLPIIMIIFGIGFVSRTIVVAVASFFPMLINTMAGVRQIHPIYFDVARNSGASRMQILRRVVLPGSTPFILAGVRLGLNVSLSISLAVELLLADKGIGTLIWMAWQTMRIEELYAAIVTAALVGISIRLFVQVMLDRCVPWATKART